MGVPANSRTLADVVRADAAPPAMPTSRFDRAPSVLAGGAREETNNVDVTGDPAEDDEGLAVLPPHALAGLPYAAADEPKDPRRRQARLVLGTACVVMGVALIGIGLTAGGGGPDGAPVAAGASSSSSTSTTLPSTSTSSGSPTEVAGVTVVNGDTTTTTTEPGPTSTTRPRTTATTRPRPTTTREPGIEPPPVTEPLSLPTVIPPPPTTEAPTTAPPTTEAPTTTTEPPTTTTTEAPPPP